MNKTRFCRLSSLLLVLVLLLSICGCSFARSVVELADVLIESAAITNSDDPLPSQEQPASSDALQLIPETKVPAEQDASDTNAGQAPAEQTVLQTEEDALPAEETAEQADRQEEQEELEAPAVLLNSAYTSRDDVALYIHLYNHLPPNFITKSEARKCGWEGGSLEGISGIPSGSCIGGDRFGNNEGLLPKVQGRTYYECDIDTQYAKSRGAKRIVFSNDGLIYYTEDHYESFELLYGEE